MGSNELHTAIYNVIIQLSCPMIMGGNVYSNWGNNYYTAIIIIVPVEIVAMIPKYSDVHWDEKFKYIS